MFVLQNSARHGGRTRTSFRTYEPELEHVNLNHMRMPVSPTGHVWDISLLDAHKNELKHIPAPLQVEAYLIVT